MYLFTTQLPISVDYAWEKNLTLCWDQAGQPLIQDRKYSHTVGISRLNWFRVPQTKTKMAILLLDYLLSTFIIMCTYVLHQLSLAWRLSHICDIMKQVVANRWLKLLLIRILYGVWIGNFRRSMIQIFLKGQFVGNTSTTRNLWNCIAPNCYFCNYYW